ncbi:Valacyclovir hydrolase, partial [Gryllus bimaculatus]
MNTSKMIAQVCRLPITLGCPGRGIGGRFKTLDIKTLSTEVASAVERKIEVNGVNINYIKVGNGPHNVLCTPGALGSIWTDFKPQIDNMNKSRFTLVVWDPPGYGKSIPPKRDFSPGFHHRDADFGIKLMQVLNIEKYSLLGWSNGGIASMIMAAKSPQNINKLVLWGSNSYFSEEEGEKYKAFRDHSVLSPTLKAPYIALYGQECYDEMWTSWIDATAAIMASETKGDICKTLLPKISCPTFVLHGQLDINIAPEHPHYIIKNVKNSRLDGGGRVSRF